MYSSRIGTFIENGGFILTLGYQGEFLFLLDTNQAAQCSGGQALLPKSQKW